MPDDPVSDRLLHQDHTVLILRLTLDPQHQLYQGLVIDQRGQTVGKFRDWQELVALLQQWQAIKPTEPLT